MIELSVAFEVRLVDRYFTFLIEIFADAGLAGIYGICKETLNTK